ncbi:class I SAM-dependent DNA methyltransferase [Rhodoplanes sp. TEM]|uniref:site-specific DNA-methyltransferase (adenine-specific) n=1 Tax=Rhodoplanes tepidamans TaxID=200616 RepID=A0ABT5JD05_RHOTP|nr:MULTISPECIES: DNA methyltransferase [Rhodoplanes]MDC7787575.1 class I SAM-dependent DNA methyltransferase [Rhodoplanes tepidamans]MDC7984932.1 class I SAM-dependent DNA methyltransferase [Rhodoplanes sp. TEM]MDQ0358003.1 type II restriction/modification system DNA methylase subunit YeeA [Rhodoplanes tepidamans]
MTPQQFIRKWKPVALTEKAAAQTHFLDLCAMLGHDDPVTADPAGEWFAFEKGVTKTGGGDGFADVWKKGFFAWEYKKKKRNLDDALAQLVRYAAALENPPLQVACDTDRFLIRTAWTNAVPKTYELSLDDLDEPKNLEILRAVFFEPHKLRPTRTRAAVTKEAADKFSTIALRLQGRGTPEEIAHFVNQLVFCFFAHSVKLLPNEFFPKLLKRAAQRPENAKRYFDGLFAAMEKGGDYDLTEIAYFNGGLFDGRRALPLDAGDCGLLLDAASLDWSQIDPIIFGTLFERFLDPEKRGQIGAHYTDAEKIMMIVDPVIVRPLAKEWEAARAEIEALLTKKQKPPKRARTGRAMSPVEAAEEVRSRHLERLRTVSILDPACGSGNFLYLALQAVKDLELRANLECEALGLSPRTPAVGPEIVRGLEINPLAAELARTTIWIGDIQWGIRNGIYARPEPILRTLDTIECRDALITRVAPASPQSPSPPGSSRGSTSSGASTHQGVDGRDEPSHDDGGAAYVEAEWPAAEFIVGNPPFLGGKLMRTGLGDDAVDRLFTVYDGRVPREADLVTYWFEKAMKAIVAGRSKRVGLVATNSIRGGANRRVLDQIAAESRIFEAWSDEPWVIDGAAVRVSLVCFGVGEDGVQLNGNAVDSMNPDLSTGLTDVTKAERLVENLNTAFIGRQKDGPIDISGEFARELISAPLNPNGRSNTDVVHPWMNASAIVRINPDKWLIDFKELDEEAASLYQAPFEFLRTVLKPIREQNRDRQRRSLWWRPGRSGEDLRTALSEVSRFIITPRVAKHRVFVWAHPSIIPDSATAAIARDDDTTFGILHSRFHEAWSLRLCTWLGVGNDPRYTPTTTFETFPFPAGLTPNIPAEKYADDPRAVAIAAAAKRLDDLRSAWLNPPDLIRIEPEVFPTAEQRAAGAKPLYPDRILPKDAQAAVILKKRTLTNLYNERPQWLSDAHRDLDAAVAAAYGWPADISDEDALAKLLELNLSRASAGTAAPPASEEEDDEEA